MVVLALVLWVVVTTAVAVLVSFVLRHLDAPSAEETVDPVELHEAMGRHPSRRPKVA